jgi:hypothetical protein
VEAKGAMSRESMVGAPVPWQEKVMQQNEAEGAGTPDSCLGNLDSGAILEELVTLEAPGMQEVEAVQEAECWCGTPEAGDELCAPDSGPRDEGSSEPMQKWGTAVAWG